MNDFDLPPRRSLPPEVGDRIRAKLTAGSVPARRRGDRIRSPLAVAASVAVLAAGAVIVTQSGGNPPEDLRPGTTGPETTEVEAAVPLSPEETDEALGRCWAAVQNAGKTDQFPARERWRPVLSAESQETRVVGVRADDQVLFCQTTRTSVTVSDPNATPSYAEHTKTGALLATAPGVVGGVIDPSWPHLGIGAGDSMQHGYWVAEEADGLFLQIIDVDLTAQSTRLSVYDIADRNPDYPDADGDSVPDPGLSLPKPPAPAVSAVDRPVTNPPDRTSERGRFLGTCLDNAENAVADKDIWQPGASVELGGNRMLLARSDIGIGDCSLQKGNGLTDEDELMPDTYSFYYDAEQVEPGAAPRLMSTLVPTFSTEDGEHRVVGGTVSEQAASMQLVLGNDTVIDADVANGTFAALLPAGAVDQDLQPTPGHEIATVRVLDVNGAVLYEGPLAE